MTTSKWAGSLLVTCSEQLENGASIEKRIELR